MQAEKDFLANGMIVGDPERNSPCSVAVSAREPAPIGALPFENPALRRDDYRMRAIIGIELGHQTFEVTFDR
jgi:hypothetical protein